MAKKPHVLLLVSDQHSPRIFGAAGDPHIRTPHLDALAAAGTRFGSAYCPSPLCGPSRAAFLTGLSPRHTGVEMNNHVLPSHLPTFAHAMTAAGYRSVLCGRMHFIGPDQRHGFEERLVGDFGSTDVAERSNDLGIFNHSTGQDGKRLAGSSGPGRSPVMQYDEAVARSAVARCADHTGSAPLFMTVGFYGPHNPFTCPPDLFAHYHGVLSEDDGEARRAFYATAHPAIRAWIDSRNLAGLDPTTHRRARAGYHGLVEHVDGLIGAVVEGAREALGDDLHVLYISDHGEMAGEKGMFWKSNFYEPSVGVPWIWTGPGIAAGRVVNDPVSLLDLAPTLATFAGVDWPVTDGVDLWPVLCGGEADPERSVFAQLTDRRPNVGPCAMIRRGAFKLVEYARYENPLLFNLREDPRETTDLARDPRHAGIVAELRRELMARWDPARSEWLAASENKRMALLRLWCDRAEEPVREHWACDTSELFLGPQANQ